MTLHVDIKNSKISSSFFNGGGIKIYDESKCSNLGNQFWDIQYSILYKC